MVGNKKYAIIILCSLMSFPSTGFCLTDEQIRKDFISAITNVFVPVNDDRVWKFYNVWEGTWNKKGKWIDVRAYMPQITNISISGGSVPPEINIESVNVKVEGAPLYIYKIGPYENKTPITQTWLTESQSQTIVNSFTYSNSENITVNLGYEFAVKTKAELLGSGAESTHTFKFNTSTGYTHTTSNTKTTQDTITFPSQALDAAANGTTSLIGYIYPVEFSGSFKSYGTISGKVKIWPRFAKNIPASVHFGNRLGPENYDYPKADAYESMDLYEAYKIIEQYAPAQLPKYITLDHSKKEVKLKEPIENTFKGKAGYRSMISAEYQSFDSNNAKVTMSLSDYKNPVTRAARLKAMVPFH